jgi:tRNA (cytidine32/guanosine34-2'-O)-methyltransferase
MISQLEPFFAIPPPDQKVDVAIDGLLSVDEAMARQFKEGDCEVDGYDAYGRRGGVWVRKPRSSRPGSAGQLTP